MEEKKCPVDRGKLLKALECCKYVARCGKCPYRLDICAKKLPADALDYINYLEQKLGVTG